MKELKKVYEGEGYVVYRSTLPPIGVNTFFIIHGDSLLLVDPGLGCGWIVEKYYPELLPTLKILLTHTHFDHIAGIPDFKGCTIRVSAGCKAGLYTPEMNLSTQFGGAPFVIDADAFVIEETIEGHQTSDPLEWDALSLPGHTPGDMIYDFGGFLFSGDVLFERAIGRTDFPFSNEEQMEISLDKLSAYLKKKDARALIFPGHMTSFTVEYTLKHNPFLRGRV